MTRANAAGTPGPVTLAVSVGESDRHLGSVPGQTSDPATGIAPPRTAGLTTSPAVLAASNVALSRMTLVVVVLIATFPALEAQDLVAIDLDGNLGIGFAPGEFYVALKKILDNLSFF